MSNEICDIAYGSHPLQAFDIYFPERHTENTPVVFLIHGGGFVMGRKEDFTQPAILFRNEGFVVVNLSHRLVDAGWFSRSGTADGGLKIADQLADVEAAVQRFKKGAAEWGFGTQRLYIAGHSAGAILAMLYMMSDTGPGAHHVRAAGNWAGVTDLTISMNPVAGFLSPWQQSQIQGMYERMIDYSMLTGRGGDAKSISPYWIAQQHGSRPIISLYPEHNVVLHFPGEAAYGMMQTQRFHELLRSQGVVEEFTVYKGCDHSFRGSADAWQRVIHQTAAFFNRH